MAADPRLFEMLAQALSQPSKAYRAAQAGLEIPKAGLEGYVGGLDAGNAIRKSKFASSPAGSYFESGTVPYGFKSDIPVDEFTTLAPFAKPNPSLMTAFVTPEQAKSLGVDPKVIDSFGGKPIPRQIAQGSITANTQKTGNDIKQQVADSMKERVSVMKTGQQLSAQKAATQYGGGGAAQPSIKESFNRVAQVRRTRGLLDQINAQGGQASPQQRAELAMSTARTLNPSGVMTNEAMDMMLPQSAVGKYGGAMQYLQNAPYDTDFAAFSKRFSDLLDREEKINQGIIQSGGKYAAPFVKFGAQVPPQDVSQGNPNISTGAPGQGTGDPEADAAIRAINTAPISDNEKQMRISAVKARAGAGAR